ncbi:MAG: glycoside hydrolase family 5 protein [Actinomycetota bacterium]|nr:glycoside hydrolase family 5 protein [Actinomycetota bacterium]
MTSGRPRALVALMGLIVPLIAGAAVTSAASTTAAARGLHVVGNRLLDGSGRRLILRGVNRSGTEYACIQGFGIFDGPSGARSVAAIARWHVNFVRVPLNEDCWLGINTPAGRGGAPYRRIVAAYVRALHAAHLYVILDLHLAAPGATAAKVQLPMADAGHAPAFWRSVARRFRTDHALIFDLFNEPFGISWGCWQRGCEAPAQAGVPAYRTAGMQALVTAVRSTGARQPLLLGGLQYSSELGGWAAHLPRDPRHQEIAAQHNYGGLSPCDAGCRAQVLAVAGRHPVLFSELGETDCAHGYVDQMLRFADRHRLGYLGWAWDATSAGGWTCSSGPALITAYDGSPTPYGIGLRDHLRGLGPASPALP